MPLHFSSKDFEILDLDPPNNPTSHYDACHFGYSLALKVWDQSHLMRFFYFPPCKAPDLAHSFLSSNFLSPSFFLKEVCLVKTLTDPCSTLTFSTLTFKEKVSYKNWWIQALPQDVPRSSWPSSPSISASSSSFLFSSESPPGKGDTSKNTRKGKYFVKWKQITWSSKVQCKRSAD